MMVPIPCQRGARVGLVVLVVLWALLGAIEWCRAEVPPTIEPRVQPPRARVHKAARATAHAELVCEGGPLLVDGEVADGTPLLAERLIVERQVATCSRRPGRRADVWGLLTLWRIEEQLGVPDEARGVLGAIYCIEAGATPGERRGDWRGGVAKAHGPFQLWPSIRRWCGLDARGADDLEAAARCYWSRAEDRRRVRALHCADSWRVGEALVANGPAYLAWGCSAESSHWRQMEASR